MIKKKASFFIWWYIVINKYKNKLFAILCWKATKYIIDFINIILINFIKQQSL